MGLDIYAGTLTRYYSRNWKNAVQILCEENGQQCVMTDGDGNEIKPVENQDEIDQIRDTVTRWADNIATSIDPNHHLPLWDEKRECDYYTDKPDWEAYGALKMLQACQSLNKPLPKYVKTGWNVYDEPVVRKAQSQNLVNSLISDVVIWLPIQIKAVGETALPTGDKAYISTIELLKHELDELNQKLWQADESTILSWKNEKYYVPVQNTLSNIFSAFLRQSSKTQKHKYRTEELAQCAYSMLYQAVKFATERQVPVLLDY